MTINLNLFWLAVIVLLGIIVFLIHSGFNIKLFVKKDIHAKDCDTDIVQDLIQKFPLVKQEFINKNTIEQNVENNQEIHEINKRLEVLEDIVQKLGKKKK